MFSILLVGTDLIHKFYVSVVLKVYTGLIKGSSIYMQVAFSKIAYIFWCMIFEVATSSKWLCRFLGSSQFCCDNDLIVQINWLLVDEVWVSKFLMGPVWKFDEMRPSCVLLCTRSIQSENLWNVVPRGREKVVTFCRPEPTY